MDTVEPPGKLLCWMPTGCPSKDMQEASVEVNGSFPKLFAHNLEASVSVAQSIYLENEHLPSQHGDRVKVPFTDVGSVVIGPFGGPGAVRVPRWCLRGPGLRSTGRHSGQGLSGAAAELACMDTRSGK